MKCPKCNEDHALLLLHRVCCPNTKCSNFDQRQYEEVKAREQDQEEDKELYSIYGLFDSSHGESMWSPYIHGDDDE